MLGSCIRVPLAKPLIDRVRMDTIGVALEVGIDELPKLRPHRAKCELGEHQGYESRTQGQ